MRDRLMRSRFYWLGLYEFSSIEVLPALFKINYTPKVEQFSSGTYLICHDNIMDIDVSWSKPFCAQWLPFVYILLR